jgi:hypothetical protein
VKSELLLSLAAARGVDLQRAAEMTPKVPAERDVVTQKFAGGRRATVLQERRRNRVRGPQSRVVRRPQWTIAEIAQAAAGVPDICFRAACYAFAGDRSNYWHLHGALYREAQELQARQAWPPRVKDYHGFHRIYLPHLAKLVLDFDQSPTPFRIAPELFAYYLRITQRAWENEVADRYYELERVWGSWLETAARIVQAHLREESDAAGDLE